MPTSGPPRKPADQDSATQALRRIAQHVERSPREAYRPLQQRVFEHNCAFTAEMHNTMNAAQRQHAQRKFQRWEEDLRALASGR